MLVDAVLPSGRLRSMGDRARELEAAGYAGVWSSEVAHDPFIQLLAAAHSTADLQVGTAIAVAFARTPMSMAYVARDLQEYSGGRFVLGLGSQVRAHIERRYGMPWSHPAPRMREFVCALGEIWRSWTTGARLDFQGDFYTHTLMTPFFTPASGPWDAPPIYLAAVGPMMTRVAGEVADGLLVHPFITRAYLADHTLPAIEEARERAGRTTEEFAICVSPLVATGRTEVEMAAAIDAVRAQVAFYGSTPAYHGVLELHGWGELGHELNRLSRTRDDDRWQRMKELVDDLVLAELAVVAEPDRLGDALAERFGGLADRLSFSVPYEHTPELFLPALESLLAADGERSR